MSKTQTITIACKLKVDSKVAKEITVSLKLLHCRHIFELLIGNYQRGILKETESTYATLVKRKNGDYYIHIQLDKLTPKPRETNEVIGVDLGRTDIASTSEGESWSGKSIAQKRNHYAKMRAILQRKATKGTLETRRRCRQLLARLSGREKRFQSWLNQ